MANLQRLLCALGLLLCSIHPALAQSAPPDEAVTYHINPTHTGTNNTPGLAPPIHPRWIANLGATVSYPLIANGKVYVTAGEYVVNKVSLYALDIKTGKKVWGPIALPYSPFQWAAAAYENGRVFVVSDPALAALGGVLSAFDSETGSLLWRTTLPDQALYGSATTAFNGLVYTAGSGIGGTLYAVDEATGHLVWTAPIANGDSSSPVVTNDGVYVSYAGPQTYKFDPVTGNQIWHYNSGIEGGGGNTPVLYGGSLYIRDIASLDYNNNSGLILDSSTGTPVGYFAPGYYTFPLAPTFDQGLGFFVQNGGITAAHLDTMITAWSNDFSLDPLAMSPVIANGVVYVASSAGNIYALDENTGQQLCMTNVGANILSDNDMYYASPQPGMAAAEGLLIVAAGKTLVAIAPGAGLQGLRLSSSTVIGSLTAKGKVTLNGSAPSGGLKISLSSTNPKASVPTSITIPGGQASAIFTITTHSASASVAGSIQATRGVQKLSAPLTIRPIGVKTLSLSPSSVQGSKVVIGTVVIEAPAPSSGLKVDISSSSPSVAQPNISSLVIAAGHTNGQFTIQTTQVSAQTAVTISASAHNIGTSASLTINP